MTERQNPRTTIATFVGLLSLVADLPAGILLVSFYLWRRDLVANMIAHSAGILVAMFTMVPLAV